MSSNLRPLVVPRSESPDSKWARRRDIPIAILAWTALAVVVLWGASHIITTILLLVIASLLAYALAPVVKMLQKVMPRWLAVVIVYLIVLAAISGLLYLIVRTAIEQVNALSTYVGTLLTPAAGSQLSPLEQSLHSFGITSAQITAARSQITGQIGTVAGRVVPLLQGVFDVILDIIVIAVLSIYLLVDGSRVTHWLSTRMPGPQQSRVRFLLTTFQHVVGGYIRGQLLLSALIGLLVGIGMWVIGIRSYAVLLGVMAFLLEFIPIIGTLISGAICVLLALTIGWITALIVLAYFVLVHVFEGDVVGPRIVGKAVGLHPAVSLLALIAGGELFGIWGMLFASPIAGVIQALIVAGWSEWRETHPEEFEEARQQAAQAVEHNVADKPTEIAEKASSPLNT